VWSHARAAAENLCVRVGRKRAPVSLPGSLVERCVEQTDRAEHADAFAHCAERVNARDPEQFAIVVGRVDERKDRSVPPHNNRIGLVENPRPTEEFLARGSVLHRGRLVNIDKGWRSHGLSFAVNLEGGHRRPLS
jgi:hypothetical protein